MRHIWNGSVFVSMLRLPVVMGSGASDGKTDTHQYAPDGGRIQYKRVSSLSGLEIPYSDVRKGYEAPGGEVVFLTDEDFDKAYGGTERATEILLSTDPANIPDKARKDPYIIMPTPVKGRAKSRDKGADKAYALLVYALQATGKVAIVEWGLRERKCLAVISAAEDGYLWLEKLHYAQDMNTPDFPAPQADLTEQEKALVVQLVEGFTEEFDHAAYEDKSREVLEEIIQSRLEGPKPVEEIVPAAGQGGEAALDLVGMLQASVAEAKAKGAKPKGSKRGTGMLPIAA